MLKLLRGILLGIFAPSLLFGSHVITSYAEYRIDSATEEFHIEYHVLLDSSGISFTRNTMIFQGPVTVTTYRSGVIPFAGRLGGPFCNKPVYYEVIYKGYGLLPSPSSGAALTFDVCPPCCVNPSQNLHQNSNSCSVITIRPKQSPSGQWYYPTLNTLGTTRRPIQQAYADLINRNDFGGNFIAGVDSTRYSLVSAPQSGGLNATYLPGFSIITPLPDASENWQNGPNVFQPEEGVLQSFAIDSGFSQGNYTVGIKRTTYFNGQVYTTDSRSNLVYYHYRNPAINPLDLRIASPDSTFLTNNPSTQLSYNLDVGDTLIVDVTALGNPGAAVVLLSDTSLDLLDSTYLPKGLVYSYPRLSSLNAGGGFANLDSNKVRFSFAPDIGNLRYMRERNVYKLVFGTDSCGGDVHSVLIEVVLNKKPRILTWDKDVDSIQVCTARSPRFELINPVPHFRWGPDSLFSSATKQQTKIVSKTSRWYYVEDSLSGLHLDSVFVHFSPLDSIYPLNLDLNQGTISYQDSSQRKSTEWTIADLVKVHNNLADQIPIMAPGEYRVFADNRIPDCPHFSDTALVPYTLEWASNFGANYGATVITDESNLGHTTYRVRIKSLHPATVIVDTLYIMGIADTSQAGDRSVLVDILSSRGFFKRDSGDLRDRNYLAIPLNLAMAPNNWIQVDVELKHGLDYQRTFIPSAQFTASNFEFRNHERALTRGGTFFNTGYSVPIGIKYSNTIGLEENQATSLIQSYPQPTKDLLYVNGSGLPGSHWEIHSMSGIILMEGRFAQNEAQLDLRQLKPGVYLLKVEDELIKVIKQ